MDERERVWEGEQAANAVYRSLFDNMLNGVAHCRMLFEDGQPRDFIYLDVNRAFTLQTGLCDVVGRRASEVIPGLLEKDPQLIEAYGRVAQSGREERFEMYISSVQQWLSIAAFSPRPEHFVAVFDVVTERKRRELELRQLSLAVEQSPESIVITDLDAKIVYVNEAFVRKTGYSREELIGSNPRILNSGKTPKENYLGLWGSLTSGQTWKGEFVNRCKDGSEYVEFAIVVPICQPDGCISHYLAIKEDITEKQRMAAELMVYHEHLQDLVAERTSQLENSNTELKKAEAALLAAHDQLERRVVERTRQLRQLAVDATLAEERERQAIARDLHDDLGQTLHVAKIKLDALMKLAPCSLDPQVQDMSELLADASARVRSLTSQLSPPVLSTMGLVPALAWLAEEMERTYGLVVEVDDDGLPKPLAAAQAAILFRAVRELLINISKHAGVALAHIVATTEGNSLVLRVEDEGSGIDDLNRALSGRDSYGLASVRERIAYLNGSMEIHSLSGDGTAVTLRMPFDALQPFNEENAS